MEADHSVTIVGYDDTFPKKYFNDPYGLIPGDGAFIVKNSWGSAENTDPLSVYYWGNGGDGYFYLSYYDQSCVLPMSLVFNTEPDSSTKPLKVDMYDFLSQASVYDSCNFDFEVAESNIFTADKNEFINRIGFDTGTPNRTVNYAVYLLSDNFTSPTDGIKVAEGSIKSDFSGYHIADLEDRIPVRKGQSYSIVVTRLREDGRYALTFTSDANKNGTEYINEYRKQKYIEKNGTDEGFAPISIYNEAVVNPGESFVGVLAKDGMEWADWWDVLTEIKAVNAKLYNNGLTYDNFCIRAYPQADLTMIENEIVNPKKRYAEGDVINGRIAITNYGTEPLENVEIRLSLGKLGADNADGKIESIAPGTTKVINYKHRVRKKNLKKDKLTSSVTITVNGEPVDISEDTAWTSFTVKTKKTKA